MNAAERLWRALAAHDWAAMRSQFQPTAKVEWPHVGRTMPVDEYVAMRRERARDAVDVVHVVAEGRLVVVEGSVGSARCAGVYDLHDGLIAGAVEYWVGEAA
jgi:ketosteroid isomerase-like protein